jgi:hypothetical protein
VIPFLRSIQNKHFCGDNKLVTDRELEEGKMRRLCRPVSRVLAFTGQRIGS